MVETETQTHIFPAHHANFDYKELELKTEEYHIDAKYELLLLNYPVRTILIIPIPEVEHFKYEHFIKELK